MQYRISSAKDKKKITQSLKYEYFDTWKWGFFNYDNYMIFYIMQKHTY